MWASLETDGRTARGEPKHQWQMNDPDRSRRSTPLLQSFNGGVIEKRRTCALDDDNAQRLAGAEFQIDLKLAAALDPSLNGRRRIARLRGRQHFRAGSRASDMTYEQQNTEKQCETHHGENI
jgi:hypothetical protein